MSIIVFFSGSTKTLSSVQLSVQCSEFNVHCAVFDAQHVVLSAHDAKYNGQYAMCAFSVAISSVLYVVGNVEYQCTLYNMPKHT